jgi:beta-N-acetylhexosaminidase
MRPSVLPLLLLCALASACTSTVDGGAEDSDQADSDPDPVRARLGEVFLMEHSVAEVVPHVVSQIKGSQPGGIVFWNLNHKSGADLRSVIDTYSRASKAAHNRAMLFSTDYEGGALDQTTSFTRVPGIQRFTVGMTPLAHPRWLGVAFRKNQDEGRELARLHGKLIAREMKSLGINYPLGTVSDLAFALFANRSTDQDETTASTLMTELIDGATSVDGVVFVTKHFPGLGQTRGDTHEQIVVSPVTDEPTADKHLAPFKAVIDHTNAAGDKAMRLSILCSHAEFPVFDATTNTTVSEPILKGLLRERMGFRGLAVSDAMWMGPYGTMPTSQLMRLYVKSFLAGMDLLMIPGARFDAALTYFRTVYDGKLSDAEKTALEQDVGKPWAELQPAFKARLADSQARMDKVRVGLPFAHEMMDGAGVAPSTMTETERARYDQILDDTDVRWRSLL